MAPSVINTVGICCGEPPYEYLDKEGKIAGINKVLMDNVFKTLNIKNSTMQWKILPFSEAFLSLDSGNIDILATCLHINKERKARYDFAIISKSYLVFVNKSNVSDKNMKNVCYGLQSEAVFEKEAKLRGLNYKGYANASDVFMNFDLDKVNGMLFDIRTLKDLIKKNYANICVSRSVIFKIHSVGQQKLLHIKQAVRVNDKIWGNKIICGISSEKNSKIIAQQICPNLRLYYNLDDLIVAFRSTEIEEIVIDMNDYMSHSNLMSFSVTVDNIKLSQWLGTNKMIDLQLRIGKNSFLILKKNSAISMKNKKYGVLEQEQSMHALPHHEFEIMIYKDISSLFIALCQGVIHGILLQNPETPGISIFCEIANVKDRSPDMFNGFAFRKNSNKNFDHKNKALIIKTIEEESLKNHQLSQYKELQPLQEDTTVPCKKP